jgi:hypothetical protein
MKEYDFNIPTSWDEITLKMFEEISLAEGNPYERTVDILNILTGISEEELKVMPAVMLETSGINEKLGFLSTAPHKSMPNEKYSTKTRKYTVSLYPAKWTAAQYLDYSAALMTGDSKKLAKIIACFCVPEGHKYGDGYDFDEVVNDLYENMPITIALGYSSFFQLQLTSFVKALSAYTEKKKKRLTRRQASRLMKRTQEKLSTKSGTHSY